MYIMAPEPISTAHFINPSYQSLCLCIPAYRCLVTARQTHSHLIELLEASFSIRSWSYERRICGSVYPPIVARQRLGKHVPAAMHTHTLTLTGHFYRPNVIISDQTIQGRIAPRASADWPTHVCICKGQRGSDLRASRQSLTDWKDFIHNRHLSVYQS
jgi:hypothetical protein